MKKLILFIIIIFSFSGCIDTCFLKCGDQGCCDKKDDPYACDSRGCWAPTYCPKCKSHDWTMTCIQPDGKKCHEGIISGGDTIIYKCNKCDNEWREY